MPRHLCGKTLEDSRRLSTEAGQEPLPGGADRPTCQAARPLWALLVILLAMSVFHRLLGCIYVVP
jgi:hypothetical protein